MKTTKAFFLAALATATLLLGACSGSDLPQNGKDNKDNNPSENQLTEFVANSPDKNTTRTSMDYASGAFYWEKGDRIWVKDDDGVWQQSTNAVDLDRQASFRFKVPGKFTASPVYTVYYSGKNGDKNQVSIPATQKATVPNNTTDFGIQGDCGMAPATRKGSYFDFHLDHKASYLVFQVYTIGPKLRSSYLTKVKVTSDNNITGNYTLDPATNKLSGSGAGSEITLNVKGTGKYADGFPVNAGGADIKVNGAYMVIAPGQHTLQVDYTVKDPLTNTEKTIRKNLAAFDYQENYYYDITAQIELPNFQYNNEYYKWDAKENFWYGHEWYSNSNWQSASIFPGAQQEQSDGIPENDANSKATTSASNSCTIYPTANELLWYIRKGDPRYDANQEWIAFGRRYRGGIWFKKKAVICKEQGITPQQMRDYYMNGNRPVDIRTITSSAGISLSSNIYGTTRPSGAEIDKYFFVPFRGYYWIYTYFPLGVELSGIESSGQYWSCDRSHVSGGGAWALYIHSYEAMLVNSNITYGLYVQQFE